MTQLGKYFNLNEMTTTKSGFRNVPTTDEIDNIKKVVKVLDLIRETLGVPVRVNSGYRSLLVNNAAGGAKNSAHRLGLAADIVAPKYKNGDVYELAVTIQKILKDNNIEFDQLILEFNSWVHISFVKTGGRRECLVVDRFGTERV